MRHHRRRDINSDYKLATFVARRIDRNILKDTAVHEFQSVYLEGREDKRHGNGTSQSFAEVSPLENNALTGHQIRGDGPEGNPEVVE